MVGVFFFGLSVEAKVEAENSQKQKCGCFPAAGKKCWEFFVLRGCAQMKIGAVKKRGRIFVASTLHSVKTGGQRNRVVFVRLLFDGCSMLNEVDSTRIAQNAHENGVVIFAR